MQAAFQRIYLKIRENRLLVVVAVAGCVAMNVIVERINLPFRLPFFFDSIFTAVAGALFGVFPGVATGLGTNLMMELAYGMPNLYWQWALCNMATGGIVAVAVRMRRFEGFRDLLLVILAVALANAIIGTIIATLVFGGLSTGNTIDSIVLGFMATGRSIVSSAFLGRIVSNLIDKAIAVGIAFIAYHYLRPESEEATRS
jgi:energy-coupling factor transport system substrate-specific component